MAGRGEESEDRRAFRREVDWASMYSLLSTRTMCWRVGKRLRTELIDGRKRERGYSVEAPQPLPMSRKRFGEKVGERCSEISERIREETA